MPKARQPHTLLSVVFDPKQVIKKDTKTTDYVVYKEEEKYYYCR
jgi:hypothetical protein